MTVYTYRVIISHNDHLRGNLRRGDRFVTLEPQTSPFVTMIDMTEDPEPKKRRSGRVKGGARQDGGEVLRAAGSREGRVEGGPGDAAGLEENGPAESGTPVWVEGSEAGSTPS